MEIIIEFMARVFMIMIIVASFKIVLLIADLMSVFF